MDLGKEIYAILASVVIGVIGMAYLAKIAEATGNEQATETINQIANIPDFTPIIVIVALIIGGIGAYAWTNGSR